MYRVCCGTGSRSRIKVQYLLEEANKIVVELVVQLMLNSFSASRLPKNQFDFLEAPTRAPWLPNFLAATCSIDPHATCERSYERTT